MNKQSIIGLGIALVVVLLGLVPQFEQFQDFFSPETQEWVTELSSLAITEGTVTRVIDGDTLEVEGIGTVRLIGIDTPEVKDPRKPVECFGQEASAYMTQLVQGKQVRLEFDSENTIDRYNRTLAYIHLTDTDLDVNAEMIRAGHARSYQRFEHPRMSDYNQYEDTARNQEIGLWHLEACE